MNIPFYRHVKSDYDGHEIYQCLQCGTKIDVGDWRFGPRFCCYCGIEYKGFILPKQYKYLKQGKEEIEITEYCVENAMQWDEDDEIKWDTSWRRSTDYKVAIKYLNDERKEILQEEINYKKTHISRHSNKTLFIRHCRLTKRKIKKHLSYIKIDTHKYYRKTGKKFNINDYGA